MNKEILQANQWEHFKFAKELALIYNINHPKRIAIDNAIEEIRLQLERL